MRPASRIRDERRTAATRGAEAVDRPVLDSHRPWAPVLVTGADQHQGLAVVRGLGQAGIPVLACGSSRMSLGFYSRYATARARYAPPLEQPARFVKDVLRLVAHARPALVIPTVESTLVLLNQARSELERHTVLAAPTPDVLEYALDKYKTLRLARVLGIPAPRTVQADTPADLLRGAAELQFPVAVKPRGPALHPSTRNHLGFKVRYMNSPRELERLLPAIASDAKSILVQELAHGVGRCVSAVFRHGEPLALLAYARERELPHTGGISVVRRSIAMDDRLETYVVSLLGAIRWHGIAMVEFKYDPDSDAYSLMEINGRFQASAALSLDAGLNLPHLLACLYSGRPLPPVEPYRVGVTERWLRGDLLALVDAITHGPRSAWWRLIADFGRDFRRGVCYDEFRLDDWRPGIVEAVSLATAPVARLCAWIGRVVKSMGRRRRTTAPRTRVHRAMRA